MPFDESGLEAPDFLVSCLDIESVIMRQSVALSLSSSSALELPTYLLWQKRTETQNEKICPMQTEEEKLSVKDCRRYCVLNDEYNIVSSQQVNKWKEWKEALLLYKKLVGSAL